MACSCKNKKTAAAPEYKSQQTVITGDLFQAAERHSKALATQQLPASQIPSSTRKFYTGAHETPIGDIPHSVLPDESCIYCAYKHMSMALLHINSTRTYQNQEEVLFSLLGELECARRHTELEYSDIASSIAAAELDTLKLIPAVHTQEYTGRSVQLTHDISKIISSIHDIAETSDPDVYTKGTKLQRTFIDIDSPLVGVLNLACAWRLGTECGYESMNKALLTGLLLHAQMCLHEDYVELAEAVRDLRHTLERGEASGRRLISAIYFGTWMAILPAITKCTVAEIANDDAVKRLCEVLGVSVTLDV